ncbi:MAG: hypothetical protein Q8P02_02685, partial [Candidatus Micrarchaeota archaeon]|nr:hypothetical protein [Candidatus Micrarchaeota archaeon]
MSPRNFSALARSQLTAHANALSILGLLFLGVFIALPAFSPGILMGWDSPGHLVKTQFLVEALLPNGQWNGWFPYWHSGFGLFDLYPPGFYVFAALLHFASMGLLSVSAAFKLAAILAFALVAPASYLLLRSFGVSRLGAVFGGIFSLLVG